MEPDRIDLSALDPRSDDGRYDRLVRRVMAAAGPELARRARAGGASGIAPLALLVGWARPTLAAAAVIAVLAGGALLTTDRGPTGGQAIGAARQPAAVDALGLPDPAAGWLEADREPTEQDLVLAMERTP